MCAGVLSLALNDAMAKWLVERYSPFQILFVRSTLALPVVAMMVLVMDGPTGFRSARLSIHVLRALLGIAAAYAFILSLRFLPLAEGTALFFAAPLMVTALAALLLRDSVDWQRWGASIVGFLGVLIIVRPGSAAFDPASLLAVTAAALYAVIMISARWIDSRDGFRTMMLYSTLFPAVLCSFSLFMDWPESEPLDIAIFAAMALFGPLGVALLTQAFRLAPAGVIAPFEYTGLIWATLLGWFIWNGVPDYWTYFGAAVIVSSGIYIIVRESRANP